MVDSVSTGKQCRSFLGLALGDFVMGSFWNILSIILDRPTYTFYY